jgi:hypothetical protein
MVKMAEKPRIIMFGSSHVSAFSGQDRIIDQHMEQFESEHFIYYCQRLGPCTAYNFFWNPNYYPRVVNFLETSEFRKDTICLLIGEIDCRVHIGLNAEKASKPVDECVEEVVDRYMLCVLDLKQRGYKVLVMAVQPASTCAPCTIPDRPAHGLYEDRNRITREFNRLLERKARIHGLLFCSIFDTLMLDEVTPKPHIFMDYVHLRGSVVRPIFDEALKKLY